MLEAEKKLKVIWDLLKNTDAVRFRLTVTMYREKGEEPVVMTVEGTRAENGGWNLEPPPSKRAGPLESPAELKEKLGAIEASINKYISAHSLDEEWQLWLDMIRRQMKLGLTTDDLEHHSEFRMRALASYGYDAHFAAPVMAMAHVIEGAEALARGDLEQATLNVEQGFYWSSDGMLIADPANRFAGRARTGAAAKTARYEGVKKKVAELLQDLAPGERDSSSQVVEVVADKLTMDYAKLVEDSGLQAANLVRTIKGWLKREPDRFRHPVKRQD